MEVLSATSGYGSEIQESDRCAVPSSYEVDPRTSVGVKVTGGYQRAVRTTHADFTGLTPGFQSFSEDLRFTSMAPFVITELTLDHKGKKQGETLGASLQLFSNPIDQSRNEQRFSDGGSLLILQDNRLLVGRGQIDWQHPMAKGQILSVGGSWNFTKTRQHYEFSSNNNGLLGPDSIDQYRSLSNTLAAYATFQQAIGTWTVMPGIRVERNNREIRGPGQPIARVERTNLFPTFHLDHPLSKTLDFSVSFSKRIDRAPATYLRPFPLVEDVQTIVQGNPKLKDQSTDSYEINLHYHRKSIDAGLIIYDREKRGLWSKSYVVNAGGVGVYTFINSGRARDLGAELDISTPVARRVKANVSVNLYARRLQVASLDGSRNDQSLRYSTNASLEWDGPGRGGKPGDVAQVQWLYASASRDFEIDNGESNWLSFSYTHSFNKSLSLTGTANYLGPSSYRLLAPLIQESHEERRPFEVKVKLLKSLGRR